MRAALIVLGLLAASQASAGGKGALVAVDCPVDGAAVEIDGRVVGKTPLAPVTVSPGSHVVRVRKLGYLELTETVQARAGATARVVADLLPFAGVLSVSSSVARSQVWLDGKPAGRAPLELEVGLGKHVVVVSAPGYRDHAQTLDVAAGNTYTVVARLERTVAPAGDDLDLVPLGATPRPSPSRAAAAAPAPAPARAAGDTAASAPAGDDLELEPIAAPDLSPIGGKAAPPAALTSATGASTATPPPAAPAVAAPGSIPAPSPFVTASPEPPTPWYRRTWVLGTAAGVVVASGVALALTLSSGGGGKCYDVWTLEGGFQRAGCK